MRPGRATPPRARLRAQAPAAAPEVFRIDDDDDTPTGAVAGEFVIVNMFEFAAYCRTFQSCTLKFREFAPTWLVCSQASSAAQLRTNPRREQTQTHRQWHLRTSALSWSATVSRSSSRLTWMELWRECLLPAVETQRKCFPIIILQNIWVEY